MNRFFTSCGQLSSIMPAERNELMKMVHAKQVYGQ